MKTITRSFAEVLLPSAIKTSTTKFGIEYKLPTQKVIVKIGDEYFWK